MRSLPCHLILLLVPLTFTACRKPKVAVYQIPKEHDSMPAQPAASTPHPGLAGGADMSNATLVQASGDGLAWTAPADWRTKPGSSVRKGSYAVGPEDGPAADCAVTAFPGDVGGDLANVNRWLGQLQQSPVAENELGGLLTSMKVNGLDIRLVELTGGPADQPQRMLGAIVPFGNATWFFKLVGPDAIVQAQKKAFLGMVESIHPARPAAAAAPADMAGTAVRTADGPGLTWSAPATWQSAPPSAMRKATYRVAGAASTTAELAVTAFPGDVGGELANVNRWRNQLGLAPLDPTELAPAVTRLNVNGLAVSVVDFTNDATPATRLLGAIVPLGEATWFFKFAGPPELIEREKAAFIALLQSLQHNT